MIRLLALGLAAMAAISCGGDSTARTEDGRIILRYWEKWTGYESNVMREIVDAYNGSQEKYFVQYLEVGGMQLDRKLLVAIAGGNPPDIAGFWDARVASYAENGALLPLDELMERDGPASDEYIANVLACCRHEGFTWGLPLTPATLGLFYNKRLFREAGLDPERPPRSIAELDAMADRLTRTDESGRIVQLGFSPAIPGWWNELWGIWFGGSIWDGEGNATIDTPEMVECFRWIRAYYDRYDPRDLDRMLAAAQNFDSPQWPFFSERLAMTIQGVWTCQYAERNAPDLEWGAAPFPMPAHLESEPVTFLQSDIIVIPRGSPNPEGAWDFIRYTQRPENLEALNIGHRKFSPLREVSESYLREHPNAETSEIFRALAMSEGAYITPRLSSYGEIQVWMQKVFYDITHSDVEIESALREADRQVQKILDRALEYWELVREERREQWSGL